nr:phosphonate ABC transporter, permease protein PhnE [Marinicauda algicola]
MLRLAALLALLLAGLAPAGAQENEPLVFSVVSTERSDVVARLWEPFVADMEDGTGYEIELISASDYAGVIEAMRFGQADFGWFSNLSGLQAVTLADAEVFAKTVHASGEQGYRSVILVPADSEIRTLEDLLVCDRSLSFGLGDPNSTSGTLVPMAYVFAPRGIDPQTCFSEVTNANHEQNALAVAGGFLDAAANNTVNLARLAETRPQVLDDFRVLWTSPLIPTEPLVWRKDLPEPAKNAILSFLLTYGHRGDAEQRTEEQAILQSLQLSGFLPATNEHLLPTRRFQLVRDLAEAQADPGLDAASRAQRLAGIEADLADLAEEERRVAVREFAAALDRARARMETDPGAAQEEIEALIADFLQSQPVAPQIRQREIAGDRESWRRAFVGLACGLVLFAVLFVRSAPSRYGPGRPLTDRLIDAGVWSGLFGLLVWSFWPAQMFKLPLLAENADRMGEYLAGFARLDLTDWELYAEQTLVTVQIALWGTVVAVLLAVPFGLLAARNIAPVWIVQPVRRVMDLFRAINELVIAAVFVAAVGLGPFAGVMALAVHTTGVLAKLFSEAVESIDEGPVEGVRATGAAPVNVVVWGVIPQVLPLWASYALYRFESNTRSATILGLIGAGGIGQLLIENIRAFEYAKTATILLIIIVAVVLVDMVSQLLRRRLV